VTWVELTRFLALYPQYRLDGRMAKLEADREELVAKLQNRLRRGDFNLGRIGDERQRENLARIGLGRKAKFRQPNCCGCSDAVHA
jgi:hypothetical protein